MRPAQHASLPQPSFGAALPGSSPGYVPYGEAVTRSEFQQVTQQIGAVSSQFDDIRQAFHQLTQRDGAIMDAASKMVADQVARSNAQMMQMLQQLQLQMQQLTPPPRESKARMSHSAGSETKHASRKSPSSEAGYDSDGSSGSRSSFMTAGSPSEAAHLTKLPQFSSKDTERLMTQLAPDTIEAWLEDFTDSIEDYSVEAAAILALSPAEYEHRKHRGDIDPALDRWIVRQALNCLDKKSSDVRVLRDCMRTENPLARRSGFHLLQEIRKLRTLTGVSARRQVEDYDSAQFFKVGDPEAVTKSNATRLRESFEALPESRTGAPNALLHAVIKKMPIAVRKAADDLEDELVKAEALGREPPWSYRNLVTCVAHQLMLQGSRAQRDAGGREAAALEQRGGDPSGGGPPALCPCCGKPGHIAKLCKARCGKCNVKGCPGVFGHACVVCSTAPIPSPVPNAVGGDSPDFVRERLIKKQKELASKKEKKEAAFSEAKAAEAKEASAVDAVGAGDDLDAIDLYNEIGEEMQREASVCDSFSDDIMASLAVAGAGAVEVSLCERAADARGGSALEKIAGGPPTGSMTCGHCGGKLVSACKNRTPSCAALECCRCGWLREYPCDCSPSYSPPSDACMLQQLELQQREAQPVERGAEASAATRPDDGKVLFMLDRGSNTVLFADSVFGERGIVTSDTPEEVTGVWSASTARVERQLRVLPSRMVSRDYISGEKVCR